MRIFVLDEGTLPIEARKRAVLSKTVEDYSFPVTEGEVTIVSNEATTVVPAIVIRTIGILGRKVLPQDNFGKSDIAETNMIGLVVGPERTRVVNG